MPGDAGPAFGYASAPTVSTPENSHYYYPDTKRYTEKIRYLAHGFCLGEGSLTSERDALSISSHLNLGTGRAGQATIGDVEPDVIAWVSDLLNNVHNPDVIVLFGLKKILSHPQVNDWWNCAGGLQMDWRAWHRETPLNGYSYSFKEWTVRNAHGHAVRVVMWPNHPSRVPFGDMNVWKRAVHQYFGLDTRPSLPKRPVRVVKGHEAQ